MKVLLLGEYSAFSRNLKQGLKSKGCEVTVYTSGDSFKQIKYDDDDLYVKSKDKYLFQFRLKGTWRIEWIINYLRVRNYKKKNKASLDYILIVNPDFIGSPGIFRGYFTLEDCRKLLNVNGKLFLSACGVDLPYLKYGSLMRYWPFSDFSREQIQELIDRLDSALFQKLIASVSGVIPVMYDNAFVYRELAKSNSVKVFPTIPLPIDTRAVQCLPNIPKDKIVIFHGRSRDDFKGSEIIVKALNKIKERYPDKVDLLLPERLPFNEYIKVMKGANIVVDQCRSYSYAMNALYAMSMGKVVLSGNEPECADEFGVTAPVINILPDAGDIEKKLEGFINDPSLIPYCGELSRQFTERFHDSEKIALEYINLLEKGIG